MTDAVVPDTGTENEAGADEPEYVGADRRVSTLRRLESLKTSVDELAGEVNDLTTSLQTMTEQHKDDEARAERWRKGAARRATIGAVLIVLGFAGFGGLGGYVFVNSSDTGTKLSRFQDQSQANCLIRNAQVKSNVDFFDGLLVILKTPHPSPQVVALDTLITKQLKEQPLQVDCSRGF